MGGPPRAWATLRLSIGHVVLGMGTVAVAVAAGVELVVDRAEMRTRCYRSFDRIHAEFESLSVLGFLITLSEFKDKFCFILLSTVHSTLLIIYNMR